MLTNLEKITVIKDNDKLGEAMRPFIKRVFDKYFDPESDTYTGGLENCDIEESIDTIVKETVDYFNEQSNDINLDENLTERGRKVSDILLDSE